MINQLRRKILLSNIELRFSDVDLTTSDDGKLIVEGYVNKTNEFSHTLGKRKKFREKIDRGSFQRALEKSSHDIHFLLEHDPRSVLSSTRNNSLELKEDEIGLYMRAEISPTSWGKDSYQLIKDRIFTGMSFGFNVIKDSWKSTTSGIFERTITDLDLFEVSVVRDPAYAQSQIEARGIDVDDDIVPDEVDQEDDGKEDEQLDNKELIEMIKDLSDKVDAFIEYQISKEDADNKPEKPDTPENTEAEESLEGDQAPENDSEAPEEDLKKEQMETPKEDPEPAKTDSEPVKEEVLATEDPKKDPEEENGKEEKRSLESYLSDLVSLQLSEEN